MLVPPAEQIGEDTRTISARLFPPTSAFGLLAEKYLAAGNWIIRATNFPGARGLALHPGTDVLESPAERFDQKRCAGLMAGFRIGQQQDLLPGPFGANRQDVLEIGGKRFLRTGRKRAA